MRRLTSTPTGTPHRVINFDEIQTAQQLDNLCLEMQMPLGTTITLLNWYAAGTLTPGKLFSKIGTMSVRDVKLYYYVKGGTLSLYTEDEL